MSADPWDGDTARIEANSVVSVPARSGAAQRKRAKSGPAWKRLCGRCFQPRSEHGSGGGFCAEFVEPSGPFAEADYIDAHRERALNHEPGGPPQMAHEDPLPPGPYRRGLTKYPAGKTGRPYVILAADGQCICGWIDSRACVDAIVVALNEQFPT